MTYRSGRHFLQIPGPTNVPDRVLRAMDLPTMDHRGPEFGLLGLEVLNGLKTVFQSKQPVVILSLDEYEALLDGRPSSARVNSAQVETASHQPTVHPALAPDMEEEQVDLAGIEAAVEAVNREAAEEPKVIPITRKSQPSEPGEEQFYMEPL